MFFPFAPVPPPEIKRNESGVAMEKKYLASNLLGHKERKRVFQSERIKSYFFGRAILYRFRFRHDIFRSHRFPFAVRKILE